MTQNEMYDKINREFSLLQLNMRYGNQLEARCAAESISGFILYCKQLGFKHLVNITCVDWIEDNKFEVVYNIWSYTDHIHITVKTRLDRDNPEIQSISPLWPAAQVYEQEVHEMFGVIFTGNPDLGPLFLHNWLDLPPLRKDFNAEKYSELAYGFVDTDVAESTCIVPREEN